MNVTWSDVVALWIVIGLTVALGGLAWLVLWAFGL